MIRRHIARRTTTRRRSAAEPWRPRVPPAHLFRLLPLLGREHGVQRPAGLREDRVEPRLHRRPDGAHTAHLAIHDRIDPGLLTRRETELPTDAPANVATGWTLAGVTLTMPSMEHVRQQEQPVHGDADNAAGQGRQDEDKASGPWGTETAGC
jgi:hypothetical protein